MLKFIRSNKVAFYTLIIVWFIAGTVIFNYSIVNAQNQSEEQNNLNFLRLFVDVLTNIRRNYVEDVPLKELIEYAVKGMISTIDTDSTFVNSSEYLQYMSMTPLDDIGPTDSNASTSALLRYYESILLLMKDHFGENTTIKALVEASIEGMLKDVDPYTNFFSPEDFKDFQNNTRGSFGGLGIFIDKKGDYVTVVSPIEGTPAYKMGLQPGDRVVSVDHENVVGMITEEVTKRMKGDPGTKVNIGIDRPGVANTLFFDIIRDIIEIKSISYAFKLDSGVGYIRIRQFNEKTTVDLRKALDELEAQNIRGLLIDLRYNPGGLLNEAVDTVNEFIGPNKLVVFTKGRAYGTNLEHKTRYNRSRSGYPVVVLINEASASASEIFAGSLQDWDSALIVGKPSFGKGSVQQLYPLRDNYGLKVTISKYYIKSGRCIHKELYDKLLRGIEVSEEEQLAIEQAALEQDYFTTKGRVVKGGGGIVPDIDIEQSRLNMIEREIRRLNLYFDFSIDYYVKNKDYIRNDFYPTDAMVDDFITYGISKGLEYEQASLDSSYTHIKASLAKEIIEKKYGETEGYKAAISLDTQLMEALQLFDNFTNTDDMFEYAKRVSIK